MAFNHLANDRPRILVVGGGYVGLTVASRIQKDVKASGGVVTVVQPDENVRRHLALQAPDRVLELARRDLAGAAAASGQRRPSTELCRSIPAP